MWVISILLCFPCLTFAYATSHESSSCVLASTRPHALQRSPCALRTFSCRTPFTAAVIKSHSRVHLSCPFSMYQTMCVSVAPDEQGLLLQQEPLRTANRPPTTPGSLRQSQSPRHALQHHHSLGQQQAPPPPRQWLNHHAEASAPMLDCSDILPPDSSSPEWQGQMLTAMGGSKRPHSD